MNDIKVRACKPKGVFRQTSLTKGKSFISQLFYQWRFICLFDLIMIKWQGFLKLTNAENEKNDVKKIKIGFMVEQCLHDLFECQKDVNEITKNHT